MIDFISSEFRKISIKAIERYSKQLGCEKKSVQLFLGLDADGNNIYGYLQNYTSAKKITFLNLLGVKIDFKGYSMIAPQFIKKALGNFAKSLECEQKDVRVVIILNDDNVLLWLYKNGSSVKKINFEDLFADMPET